ncbi:MAG: RidA family protein [Chloroflexi bacterium]|nr:RidA family protein [Chloroflexota bacterium]MDA1228064.1 RidA family protein [Chloroflexota bacterium]
MEKTTLQPSGIHQPFSSYSHGIAVDGANRIIFCAGQVAADAQGNLVGENDFDAQVEQVVANMRAVLAEANATLEDVVQVTMYVVNQENAPKARRILQDHFDHIRPASTLCVLAGLADPRMLVEITAFAVVG